MALHPPAHRQLAALVVAIGALVVASPVSASTVSVDADTITFSGTGGADTVSFLLAGPTLSVTATDNITELEAGCSGNGTTTVSCGANGIEFANVLLGDGGDTFIPTGWATMKGTVNGGTHPAHSFDTVQAQTDSSLTIRDNKLESTIVVGQSILAGMNVDIVNFDNAVLGGFGSNNSFRVTGWTGGALVNGAGGVDTIIAGRTTSSGVTLTDTGVTYSNGGPVTLQNMAGEKASLIQGNGADAINVSGWTGDADINGAAGTDTLVVARDANFTATSDILTERLALSTGSDFEIGFGSIEALALTGGPSANAFDLSGWMKTASIDGGGGIDSLSITRDTDMTLTDTSLAFGSGGAFTFANLVGEIASLTGGGAANALDASGWTGELALAGLAGDDVLIAGTGASGLDGGEDSDQCNGSAATTTFTACETVNGVAPGTGGDPPPVEGPAPGPPSGDTVPTPPPPAVAADTTGPAVAADTTGPAITIGTGTLRMRRGVILVPVACPVAETDGCRGTVTLRLLGRRSVRLARAAFEVAPGTTKRVRMRVSRRNQRLLRRQRRPRARATAVAGDGAGNRTTVNRSGRLRISR